MKKESSVAIIDHFIVEPGNLGASKNRRKI